LNSVDNPKIGAIKRAIHLYNTPSMPFHSLFIIHHPSHQASIHKKNSTITG